MSMGTGSVCKASLVWRPPQRVDRGWKLDLGSNGFRQQLPFYVLFPKSPITEQGLYPNIIFLPSWICRKMTQCWGEWGFLAFPHASESFYSDMLILHVIWSAQGNINNIYSKSCTLSVMCNWPAFPIATWKWEIQMGPFRLSCWETIRQCQLGALASPVFQELEPDGGGPASLFQCFPHSKRSGVGVMPEPGGGYSNGKAHGTVYEQGNCGRGRGGWEIERLQTKNSLSIGKMDYIYLVWNCPVNAFIQPTLLLSKVISTLCTYMCIWIIIVSLDYQLASVT